MFDRAAFLNQEPDIKKELLKLFNSSGELLIFDIGGCEGEDSIRYSKLFPKAKVWVFEPLPGNQEIIKANIKASDQKNIRLFPIALSDQRGYSDFHVSSGRPEGIDPNADWDFGNKSSSLLSPGEVLTAFPWLNFKTVIQVPTDTLHFIFHDHQIESVDFIHMDVQGAELKVLTGAKDYIKHVKAVWLEVSETALYNDQPLKNDIHEFMVKNNFRLIKTAVKDGVGDLMYINSRYFKTISIGKLTFFIKR
ncbi:FkbM family methyltransferase [Mucilaginibacter endophyticus]|uniref:FkbM family methyltransferase n=1 Tax=Mucilaginibacter endophyticus TaxID=2675003 RepID=UPI000E0D5D2D|nr:FkbM family methyltransferase [Mucilaginibacter endophyticus]